MFHLIAQISFGLAAGIVAALLKPYRNSRDFAVAIGIGLIGSLCGALIGRSVLTSLSNLAGWVMAILGTLLALSIYRGVFGSRTVY